MGAVFYNTVVETVQNKFYIFKIPVRYKIKIVLSVYNLNNEN